MLKYFLKEVFFINFEHLFLTSIFFEESYCKVV